MIDHRGYAAPGRAKTPFLSAAAVFLFAFACFLPNPGLPIGSSTGLQLAQVMALISLPIILLTGLPRRHTLVALLLLLPVLVSSFLNVMLWSVPAVDVALNTLIATGLVLMVLVPVGRVGRRYIVPLLSGVAWAVVVNAIVGVYQALWFAKDKFPLPGLYQNPSFSSFITEDPERYAKYVKRPFGLFPEPSAMAASIGPWLVLFVGLLMYPKLRQWMSGATMAQLLFAVVCGVGLILISSSGFTIWLLASLLLVSLPYLKARVERLYSPGSLFVLITLVLVGVALVVVSSNFVGSRLDVQENSSWLSRLASIVWSLSFLGTSLGNLLYGVGPGQSYLLLQSSSIHAPTFGTTSVTAVWSVVMNYILETGLLGAIALVLVLIMVLRAIVHSSARLVGFSCLGTWLAGVVLTTSYLPLLPIWLLLGVFLGWDRVFQIRDDKSGPSSARGASQIPEGVKT